MSILIFLAVIFVLVLVHEWGHFIVAKKVGMRVDEFGIGFPPKLFSIRKGETEYTFNLFPIGGFVRIFGENAEGAEGASDQTRSFGAKSKWAQAAVLVAGVTMNILFAWFLFTLALGIGVQRSVSETDATDAAQLVVTETLADGPAHDAGIPLGAKITDVSTADARIDVLTPSAFSAFTQQYEDQAITITFSTKEGSESVEVLPARGVLESEPDRAAVGVALTLVERVSEPLPTAIAEGFTLTLTGLRDITIGIGTLLWDAVRLKADFSDVAGPVGIVGLVDEASTFGLTTLITFTAFISLNLAVINLLPFPALDGGRLLFVGIEAIKGSPMKPEYVNIFNGIGFLLLIGLMIAVTFNDILRIL